MSLAKVFATFVLLHVSQYLCIAGNNNQTENERQDLLHIRSKITDDPLGVMASWTEATNLHYCKWNGVTCDQTHKRVTVLNLTSSKLQGTLSPYIGNLSFLKVLYFNENRLSGIIPPEIGRLQKLQYLLLANNSIGGEIPPNISSCSNLRKLKMNGNKLVGEIPSWLGSISNLRYILLEKNRLVGTIPSSLGNLTSLITLQLHYNNLIGSVPQSLGKLLNLQCLSLDYNKLSGKVPPIIYNLSALEELELGGNQLEGELPLDFNPKLVSSLKILELNSNKFKGTIPPTLHNFTNLETLEISSNELHGQVPFFTDLRKLTRFDIACNFFGNNRPNDFDFLSSLSNATTALEVAGNNFGGTFPQSICYFSKLYILTLWENNLIGQISDCIGNLTQLQYFAADDNHFDGVMPSTIGKLNQLLLLSLSVNQLSSHIPLSIGNLTNLGELLLYSNDFEGHIPNTLGNCTYLQLLDISQNNLSGIIPTQILSLSSLSSVLDLSINHLTGSLLTEVRNLWNLGTLDISNNMISGEIPDTLGDCMALEVLNMGNNHFEGSIPQTLSKLMGLSVLDLSMNNLSGNIPSYLAHFNLLQLNLSFNNLEGEVPTGRIFNNASGISISGNSRLCGGIAELKLPHCDSNKARKIRLHNKMRVVVEIIAGCCGVMLVAFAFLYAYFCKKRKNEHPNEPEDSLLNISYQSLLSATNDFSSENFIGCGAFGVVYKGVIGENTNVAIKKFNLDRSGALKSYITECGALRKIRHRNLVKVITTCSSVDYQGNDFKALIYEYMVNGSLREWLHPDLIRRSNVEQNAPMTLNVHQRLDIAVDVAFALEYLHHHCGSPIVHCDIKPSNVLLDDDMVARVGDFGLAKFLSNDVTISHGLSSFGIIGTVGYAPPEYGMGNEVSTHGDVYSFGILLMEMFTGKNPTNEMFKDGMNLHILVKTSLPEQVTEIIDESLLEELVDDHEMEARLARNTNRTTENSNKILEVVISVLELALSCTAEHPQERLDMSEVSAMLSSIRNKFLGTRSHRPRRNHPGPQI